MILQKIKERLAALRSEDGFTLTELLVVIMIIGILLAIAIPSYLGFRQDANETAAQSNIRAAVPAVETFFAENGVYTGMNIAALEAIDAGIPAITIDSVSDTSYCIEITNGGQTASKNGPTADIALSACP